MKDLIIIGAGDFGRLAMWIAERINEKEAAWNILGFADDGKVGETVDGYPVLMNVRALTAYESEICAACAIADCAARAEVWQTLAANENVRAVTLADPDVLMGKNCTVGEGSILCAGTKLSVNAHLGKHSIVNWNCTVGHDTVLGDCCTLHPDVNLCGRVTVGARTLFGVGTKVIQGLHIAPDVVFGAGTVVVRDVAEAGTYVGVPAGRLK